MIRQHLDRRGAVTDVEILGGRTGGPYVSKDDPVANGAAAIRAVAENAVVNPTWYAHWSGDLYVPVTPGSPGPGDGYGNKFSVTIPGLTRITGYLATVGPQAVSVFPKWDRDYSWPYTQPDWPSNVLRFRLSYNDYASVAAYTLYVSVLAWGTR